MITENLSIIRQRVSDVCTQIGRNPREVTLIAVSKTFGNAYIRETVSAGVFDIGENYVQELQRKHLELELEPIRWHFIGHLQRNKVKYIAPWIHCIHSVDSLRLGEEISQQAVKLGRTIDVLVEVNTSGEQTKFGLMPEQTKAMVKELRLLSNINVQGLMTIGPLDDTPEVSRPAFRLLKTIQQDLKQDGIFLPHLSMGMTNDFHVALEEGATMIRIGSAIFGQRQYQQKEL